jgi:hypothetical protein
LVGYGPESEVVVVRAAKLPETPTDVTSIIVDRTVEIEWTAPYDGGSPIYEYVVMILQNDGLYFSRDMVDCPGTKALGNSISTKCVIPFETLRAAPYSLEWASFI